MLYYNYVELDAPCPLSFCAGSTYGTRGNSCNENAHFFLSLLSPSAVSLRPCGARLKLSGVLLWSHGVRLELDVRSFATASRTPFEAKRSFAEASHGAVGV